MDNKKELLGIGIVLFLLIFVVGYYCPIYWILGIPCPGCGMTRSLIAFVQGNFTKSFHFHALLIPSAILGLIYLFLKEHRNKVIITWCTLMIIYYLYRMICLPIEYNWNSLLGNLIQILK